MKEKLEEAFWGAMVDLIFFGIPILCVVIGFGLLLSQILIYDSLYYNGCILGLGFCGVVGGIYLEYKAIKVAKESNYQNNEYIEIVNQGTEYIGKIVGYSKDFENQGFPSYVFIQYNQHVDVFVVNYILVPEQYPIGSACFVYQWHDKIVITDKSKNVVHALTNNFTIPDNIKSMCKLYDRK